MKVVSLCFSFPWFIVWYRFECQRFMQNKFQCLYSPSNFCKKSVPKKPGLLLSTSIVSDWHPTFLFSLIYCVISVWVSAVYIWKWYLLISRIRVVSLRFLVPWLILLCKIPVWVSVVYAKYAIILDWYRYVSLSPDLLCNICLSITSWCVNIRLNGYTLHWVSTKNQLTKKPGFPLSAYILLAWGNIDALCNRTETGRRLETTKVKMAEI